MNATLVWNYIGAVLYPNCENWKALLARDLQVKPNTVTQWVKGHTILTNPEIVRDLIEVLDERKKEIEHITIVLQNMVDNKDAA